MKNVIVAIVVGIFLFTVPVTAAPLEISGETTIRFQTDTAKNAKTQSGTMFSFTLRGEQKIGRNVSLFARLGAQYATNPALADFSSQNVKSAFTIDQFGLVYKPGKFTYTLGRQEAIIGTTALLSTGLQSMVPLALSTLRLSPRERTISGWTTIACMPFGVDITSPRILTPD